MNKGLAYCGANMGNAFCIIKLIEVIVSVSLLLLILHDFIVRYSHERELNFFVLICTLMTLALLCNIFYSLFHQAIPLNFLQGFTYNIYFNVIVYYVALKLVRAWKNPQHLRKGLIATHILFGVNVVFLISVLIENFVTPFDSCSEIWYLVVNGEDIGLSILLLFIGLRYTKKQQKKLVGIHNPENYKNPLMDIWIWISINIFSQIASFIETIFFQVNQTCLFSNNYSANEIVKLIFVILSFHLGMVATVLFFRKKYENSIKGEGAHSQRKQSVTIELVEDRDNTIVSPPT